MENSRRGPENQTIQIKEKQVVYDGFFRMERYRLNHSLYAGGMSGEMVRELFERGHAAAVLPYDPDNDTVVLVEQFRVGALDAPGGAWLREIVAGIIEEGESAEEVARREAEEEANCAISELEFICEYLASAGGSSERLSLFCGRVDSRDLPSHAGLVDEHEDIRVMVVPFDTAMAWLADGTINSAPPIIALQWLALHKCELVHKWGGQAAE